MLQAQLPMSSFIHTVFTSLTYLLWQILTFCLLLQISSSASGHGPPPPPPPRQSFCPVNKRWPLCSHCLWNKVRKKWLCCLYSTMLILNGLSKVPVHFAFVSVVAPGWMWNIELCIRTEAHRPQDHHCCCCCFESWDPSRRPHLIAWLETPAVTSLIGAQPQVLPSNSNTFLLCFSAYWLVRDENKLDLK